MHLERIAVTESQQNQGCSFAARYEIDQFGDHPIQKPNPFEGISLISRRISHEYTLEHRGATAAGYEIAGLGSVHRLSHRVAVFRDDQCLQAFPHCWRKKNRRFRTGVNKFTFCEVIDTSAKKRFPAIKSMVLRRMSFLTAHFSG
jgi:hypothetical protein